MSKDVNYSEPAKPSDGSEKIKLKPGEKILRVLFTGGGSGGHTNPLLAVAEALREIAPQYKITPDIRYLGPNDEHSEIFKAANIPTNSLFGAKWRRYASLQNILDIPRFFISFIQVMVKLLFFMPDIIFTKGGTGALPVVIVGWLYRIPVLIHESDAIPGLTNAISGRFAVRIAVSFDRAKNYFPIHKTAITGTPIRPSLLTDLLSQKAAKEVLGFEPTEPVVLIIGGSQGAERINEFIVTNLEDLTTVTQVIHQTGTGNFADIQKLSRAALLEISPKSGLPKRYHVVPFLKSDELKNALTAADLVISRAGSASLFEIAAFKKPAILIPLPGSARDHQRLNAYEFAKSGGAVIIEQVNLIPGIFINQIKEILQNHNTMDTMSKGSASFYISNAAEVIAQEIIKIGNKS